MAITRYKTGPRMSQAVAHGDTVYTAGQVADDTREKHLAALARAGFSYDIARQVIDAESEEDLEQPS